MGIGAELSFRGWPVPRLQEDCVPVLGQQSVRRSGRAPCRVLHRCAQRHLHVGSLNVELGLDDLSDTHRDARTITRPAGAFSVVTSRLLFRRL